MDGEPEGNLNSSLRADGGFKGAGESSDPWGNSNSGSVVHCPGDLFGQGTTYFRGPFTS